LTSTKKHDNISNCLHAKSKIFLVQSLKNLFALGYHLSINSIYICVEEVQFHIKIKKLQVEILSYFDNVLMRFFL